MKKAKERQAEMGQIVHYILRPGLGSGGERPAIVTSVVGLDLRLVVFPAFTTDFPATGGLAHACPNTADHDAGKRLGTWHWPEE